jgi:thiamine transport system substrate-binding protein
MNGARGCRLRAIAATAIAVVLFGATACGGDDDSAPDDPERPGGKVVLMAHDSFVVADGVFEQFERDTGTRVEVLRAGDAGLVLNQAILNRDDPQADVLFGVDNTFLSRALDEELFEPYEARGLDAVDPEFVLDGQHRVTPIDYGDVCLNYDREWFAGAGRPAPPASLDDLVDPAYEGLTVVEDAAQSSPGLAFLLATIAEYGDGWQDYWERLRDNDVRVDDGWEVAYNGSFTVNGGDRPIVVSYASSPPADVVYADPPKEEPSIAAVLTSCFRQVEFAGVLRGAPNEVQAQRLVDFMVGETFQAAVPLSMFVYPVREGTPLPEVFARFGQIAERPAELPPEEIGKQRDEWVEQWSDVMQR